MSLRFSPKSAIIAATASAIVAGVGAYVWHQEHRLPLLDIYLFALKSGQSAFIRTPEDRRILVNGGSNSEIIRRISKRLPFYSRRIDALIVTDTSAKNVSGLIDVLERYAVDRAYIPGVTLQSLGLASSTDPAFRTFLAALRDKKVLLEEMHAGDTIELGQKVRADVLFPSPPETFSYSKASGPQAVLQIIYGDTSVIVLGDVSRKIQKFIAASHSVSTAVARTSLPADKSALVVSHGGAADDLSAELIDVATADFLVYSRKTSYAPPEAVAEKKSRVPHSLQDTRPIERINLRERGEVQIVSDGVRLSVLDTR